MCPARTNSAAFCGFTESSALGVPAGGPRLPVGVSSVRHRAKLPPDVFQGTPIVHCEYPVNIFVFDPSLRDQGGQPSTNLGDLIIRDACDRLFQELFPDKTPARASTHALPRPDQMTAAAAADLVVVAGTNLLVSDLLEYNQWKLVADPLDYVDPSRLNAVLCGVGWWQYQPAPTLLTKNYYARLLHQECSQSVRDAYSASQLAACGVSHILNTSCPTLWNLHGRQTARPSGNRRCLFCLTDYAPAPDIDDRLVRQLAALYPDGLVFFPQGDHDLSYAASLPAFVDLASHITTLPHRHESFLELLRQEKDLDYVGTRLHAGVWCLEHQLPSLILAVDNRAAEIGRDTGLPVIARGDEDLLAKWHAGQSQGVIQLPLDAISTWKERLVEAAHVRQRTRLQTAPVPCAPRARVLNLGCGGRLHPDWVNIDQTATRPGVLAHDLTQPLPFAAATFDAVYASHVLEHFSQDKAEALLGECLRLLRPGGILRLVVPDLEWLARRYLLAIEDAAAGTDPEANARHEYAVINLVDQLCRHEPGGEMLRFWRRDPMPAGDYVLETNGLEVLRTMVTLRQLPAVTAAAPLPWWRRLLRRIKGVASCQCAGDDTALVVGRFRLSGEPHLWMYDRISLSRLLARAGFVDIVRHQADTSGITNFATFGLDADERGQAHKPDSLFLEAKRP